LLDRANGVSHPAHTMPNYRQDVSFRAYGVDGSVKDGRFIGIFSGDIESYEWFFGDYHAVSIHYPDKIVENRDYRPTPRETMEMDNLTPLLIGNFDKSDIIDSITPENIFGRPAKCIQFETVNARTVQSNEICVDSERGTLIRWNVGDDLIEDTDYSQFQGVWWPTHIRHYINGSLRMEIEQTFTVIDGFIDWARLTPPNAVTLHACNPYRRPIIKSAPQPASAGAGPWYDVEVHAVIGPDGRVHDASLLPKGRDDLEKQALQIVSTWTFSPGLCSGKPIPVAADLVIHFPPQ
jgi:Gram-negative bacterial TonB protein C-terminal